MWELKTDVEPFSIVPISLQSCWPREWKRTRGGGGGGHPWEFLMGLCRSVLQFSHRRSQTWPLRNYFIITWIRAAVKKISRMIHFESSHISLYFLPRERKVLLFLLIWNWNDKFLHTLPLFPRKPYPIPDQNGQNLYPFSDQDGARTLPFEGVHTYMPYIREYPPEKDSKASSCW